MSAPFWVRFSVHKPGCVEAPSKSEAHDIAAKLTGETPTEIDRLPYPADPRLNVHRRAEDGIACPSFCHSPVECAGRTSCPQRYACSE